MMKIEKRGYSSNPWRLIDSEGYEVEIRKTIKSDAGVRMNICSTVCGNTKKECTAEALKLLESLLQERENKNLTM